MPSLRALLLAVLAASGAVFGVWTVWMERRRAARAAATPGAPRAPEAGASTRRNGALVGVGFLTDFLDTLGIGSFATTTSLYKLGRLVADQHIPGTLIVGHALPTLAEAFIYITVVEVDMTTLVR